MKKIHTIVLILLVFIIYGGYCVYACIDYTRQPNIRDVLKEDCENYYAGNLDGISDNIIQFCKENYLKKDGFLSMHYILVLDKFNSVTLPVVAITIALAIIWTCSFLKNKLFLYYETRLDYKKILRKILKEAYRFIWFLPIVMLGVFIFEISYVGLDCTLSLTSQEWSSWAIFHPILFIFLYLLNLIMYLSLFTNIALVWSRKNKNYIISIISSFLTILSIQLFFEYVIKIPSTVNLLNFFRLNDRYGIGIVMLFGIICCSLSWIAVYFAYKNREKFYLDINK